MFFKDHSTRLIILTTLSQVLLKNAAQYWICVIRLMLSWLMTDVEPTDVELTNVGHFYTARTKKWCPSNVKSRMSCNIITLETIIYLKFKCRQTLCFKPFLLKKILLSKLKLLSSYSKIGSYILLKTNICICFRFI